MIKDNPILDKSFRADFFVRQSDPCTANPVMIQYVAQRQ